jgi:hypothetical protein
MMDSQSHQNAYFIGLSMASDPMFGRVIMWNAIFHLFAEDILLELFSDNDNQSPQVHYVRA